MGEVLTILKSNKAKLFAKYPIKSMALFGSHARGEAQTGSDVDILVELTQHDGWKFLSLVDELETILNKKVDLVSKDGVQQQYLDFFSQQLVYV
jgi:uncharacterized protein